MRFPDDAPVTAAKLETLRARVAGLSIDLARVEEQGVRAQGPGGQKVNKTESGVRLAYDLGERRVAVKWTRERSRALNRFLALRELVDEVEMLVSPATSERLKDRARAQRRKGRARRRQAVRSAAASAAAGGSSAPREVVDRESSGAQPLPASGGTAT